MTGRYATWFSLGDRDSHYASSELEIVEQYIDGTLALHDAADQLTASSSGVLGLIMALAEEDSDAHPAFIELLQAIFTLGKPGWTEEETKLGWGWRDRHDSKWSRVESVARE